MEMSFTAHCPTAHKSKWELFNVLMGPEPDSICFQYIPILRTILMLSTLQMVKIKSIVPLDYCCFSLIKF